MVYEFFAFFPGLVDKVQIVRIFNVLIGNGSIYLKLFFELHLLIQSLGLMKVQMDAYIKVISRSLIG